MYVLPCWAIFHKGLNIQSQKIKKKMDACTGEIRIFAGNYAPESWAICDGSKLSINDYQTLFSLLGKTYGGDGVTNFGLPDLRGRIIVGVGQGAGLSNYTLGNAGGQEGVVLTNGQIQHQHSFMVSTDVAATNVPGGNSVIAAPDEVNAALTNNNVVQYIPDNAASVPSQVLIPLNTAVISTEGSANLQAHENRMPFLAINYIICLNGIYPQFNN
jgi:microcystin-dependent protein